MQTNEQTTGTTSAGISVALDLETIDVRAFAEKGSRMVIRHPATGAMTDSGIYLQGSDSPAYQKKKHEIIQRNMEQAREKGNVPRTPDELLEDNIELLAAVTTGWDPLRLGGVEYVFSEESARRLYRRWVSVREQADAYIHKRANFFPSSPTV